MSSVLTPEALQLHWEKSEVGCAIVSQDGVFLAVNARFCGIVGYTDVELVGKNFAVITDPHDVGADQEMARRVAAGESESYRMTKTYIKKDKMPVLIELVVWPVKNIDGSFQFFLSQVIPRVDIVDSNSREVHVDSSVVLARFLTQNQAAITKIFAAIAAVLTAVAYGLTKFFASQ